MWEQAHEEAKFGGILTSRTNNKQIKRFREHTYGWLIEMLATNTKSTFLGCEL